MSKHGMSRPENAAAAAFQDAALGVEFKWKARDDKLKKQGLNPDDVSKEHEMQRAAELRREMEKLKQQRTKRDEERAALLESRSNAAGDSLVSHVDEDKFLFLQLNRRALIRLNEGRPKHIDWLILIYLHAAGLDSLAAIEANTHAQHEKLPLPRLPADALTPQDVLDMIAAPSDASIMQQQHQQHSIAWQLLAYQHRKSDTIVSPASAAPIPSSNTASSSVATATTDKLIQGALQQLEKLKVDIQLFLDLEGIHFSPGPQVEGYWRAILALLNHKENALRSHQGPLSTLSLALPNDDNSALFVGKTYAELVEQERLAKEAMNSGALIDDDFWQAALSRLALFKADARLVEIFNTAMRHSMPDQQQHVQQGSMSTSTSAAVAVVDSAPDGTDDMSMPGSKRRKLDEDSYAQSFEESYLKDAEKNMENGEELFDSEVSVTSKHVAWMDKYRPRKPKYFNRVKTGYEWNKYNQTHYGPDNPPPKIVQGYKFNIFYPDLIDKSKTPQYFLEKSDSPDFVILRFHAGPPYEDIAFKIVNKEWEQSQKHGFKCQFSHGILYLWFNFKRYRYRR
eukprot:TRINITY_DN5782_c0_g1_i1.p1 TRINITY_DN5782_c0_g1~~TRINITY_DN5782_c0_g1_i1.p1  ORF type:complete len:568 (-),score=144.43 TRINITY_DN5782_c0_g1_i1:281-1984(-)